MFEDDELIVIDKPAGLVVHPAAGHATGTLVNALIAHCGDSLSGIGGVKRPGIVHRLDKDTTGLMVVAKTDRAHQALAAQFADHGRTGPLQRGYLAFAWGAPTRPKGTVDAPIDRHPQEPRQDGGARRAAARPSPTGRCWSAIQGTDGKPVASLIACRLETGRTHQIRVHLAHIGHPLLGDAHLRHRLQDQGRPACRRQPARPWRLLEDRPCMPIYWPSQHPTSGQKLEFRSELPADLARLRHSLATP